MCCAYKTCNLDPLLFYFVGEIDGRGQCCNSITLSYTIFTANSPFDPLYVTSLIRNLFPAVYSLFCDEIHLIFFPTFLFPSFSAENCLYNLIRVENINSEWNSLL